jgi:hypothetical protein
MTALEAQELATKGGATDFARLMQACESIHAVVPVGACIRHEPSTTTSDYQGEQDAPFLTTPPPLERGFLAKGCWLLTSRPSKAVSPAILEAEEDANRFHHFSSLLRQILRPAKHDKHWKTKANLSFRSGDRIASPKC